MHATDLAVHVLSSTQVRWAVRNGRPLDDMVPAGVQQVIRERNLYHET